jgi:predicted amidohydrolase
LGEICLGWFWHGERRGRSYDEITVESLDYHQRTAKAIPGPTTEFVGRLAREHDVGIAFGVGERTDDPSGDGKPCNAVVLVDPAGTLVAKCRQRRLACGIFKSSSEMATTAGVEGERTAMLICSDAQSMALLWSIRRARPSLVLHALAAPQEDPLFTRAMAAFFSAWVVTSNRVGGEPTQTAVTPA